MALPLIDLLVFLVYIAGIVLFGASFYFRNTTASAFTSGGGTIPSWVVGMSIFATFVSSISFLALPGNAYQTNWNGFIFSRPFLLLYCLPSDTSCRCTEG